MEFTFETEYSESAITAMAEALRKTIRRKSNRRSRRLGWVAVILGLVLTAPREGETFVLSLKVILTWAAMAAIFLALLFEDRINGYFAKKRMLTGMDKATTHFTEEHYITSTALGNTEFFYENIRYVAETADYFIFIFDKSHAQVYDKHRMTGDSLEDFRIFMRRKTGKRVQSVS